MAKRQKVESKEVMASTSSEASTSSASSSDSNQVPGQPNNQVIEDSPSSQSGVKWPLSNSRPYIDLVKTRSKLHHTIKTLRSLVKKTKTFELQKLVKKLKSDPSLEAEMESLKSLDTALLAGRALVSKMVKAKLLPRGEGDEEDHVLLGLVKEETLLGDKVLGKSGEIGKVEARVLSSKVLADEITRRVGKLAGLVGVQVGERKGNDKEVGIAAKGKKKQVEPPAEEEEEEREWSGSEDDDDVLDEKMASSDDEESADEAELERIGQEKLAALGDLSQWDGLIGSDSDPSPSQKKRKRISSLRSEESSSDEDNSSEEEGKSNFLPSLSTGFIGGHSDDDWSDAEADLADRDLDDLKSSGKKKERKNRMGQRARKASYEKKYGRNANHLKLLEKERKKVLVYGEGEKGKGWSRKGALPPQEDSKPKLEEGVDMRRVRGGARFAGAPREAPRALPPQVSVAPQPRLPPPPKPTPSTTTAQEMHPSWVAKQKQKELAAQIKPAGKKITFD